MTPANISTITLAIAISLLAAALWRIGGNLPALNQNLDRISSIGEAVSGDVPEVIEVANRYEPHIDPLLKEMAAYRQVLPEVLTRIDALNARLAAIEAQLPKALEHADRALVESRAWRPISAQIVDEAQAWRTGIPDYLSRSEQLVARARSIGAEASSGALTGLVTGTLSLPFRALTNVGSLIDKRSLSARKLTDEDRSNLSAAAIALLQQPQQKLARWSSTASGHSGTVVIMSSTVSDQETCHTLAITNQFENEKSDKITRRVCLDEDGQWQVSQ